MAMANFNGLCDGEAQAEKQSRPQIASSTKSPFFNSQRWRFQLQGISKDQLSIKHHFFPIIEEGESLTSFLNHNGVPKWQDIKIQDPRAIIDRYQLQEKLQSSLNGLGKYKTHFTLTCPQVPHARTTSLIVLVPLIVLCARSIISASYARIFGSSMFNIVNKPEREPHKFRSGHWRSALRDIRELDSFDSESTADSSVSNSPLEEEQVSVEELSHAYKKLDRDYKIFLSECGLST